MFVHEMYVSECLLNIKPRILICFDVKLITGSKELVVAIELTSKHDYNHLLLQIPE
jgi:hypothetical protein